jgi:DNA-binding NarL/FixJ family response regulator
MIRVLLVDDHTLMRQGTRALLRESPDIEVVAETGQGEEALVLAEQLRPDVVLLDIRLPGLNGIDVARALQRDLPEIRVIMLTAYHQEQYVRALFAIGVHGFLLKTASGEELISAVHAVRRGEQVVDAEISAVLVTTQRTSGIGASGTLSVREQEVLALVGQGAANKDIALQFAISTRTVETHMSNAMAKLGARSRAEAIILATRRGILILAE